MSVRLTRSARTYFPICLVTAALASAAILPAHPQVHTSAAASLAQSAPAETTSQSPSAATYRIGDDDLLEINVWNEPDLKQSLPVRSDGRITLPLIGEIQASGETPSELQAEIALKLKSFITRPAVTVMVLEMNSRKFNVLGRVSKPGSYPLTATTTVLDAIAEAGGFQDFAKGKDIYILRRSSGGRETRIPFNYKAVIKGKHAEENIVLEPHDTVVVP